MNDKFVEFKESSESDRISSIMSIKRYLPAYSNMECFRIPDHLNSQIDQNVDDIAYVNIVPFRYKGAPTKSVYRVAWSVFTNKVFEVLKPDYVVPLGKRLREEVRLNYSGDGEVTDGITRTNGDTYLHNEAIEQMTVLRKFKNKKVNK